MSILIASFPDCRNLIDCDVADVVVVVFQMKNVAVDLNDFSAQAGRSCADDVHFFVDQFGK
jgi:hypothetical protein